jgi:hypothetical protein
MIDLERYKKGSWICDGCKTITPIALIHCEGCGNRIPALLSIGIARARHGLSDLASCRTCSKGFNPRTRGHRNCSDRCRRKYYAIRKLSP